MQILKESSMYHISKKYMENRGKSNEINIIFDINLPD